MSKLFNVGRAINNADKQAKESAQLHTEASAYQLASDGGWLTWLKYALFILFAYYNARLFITTVHGWEGMLTACFALLGEATGLYCFNSYTRSAGAHKTALGLFGVLLIAFSVCHATISFFRMENHIGDGLHFYCERVAFPLLFGLLLLAATFIPLTHWRKQVAAEQAVTQIRIAIDRARLVVESAALQAENQLERERLDHLREKIKLGNEYASELKNLAAMKQREHEALEGITNPEVRKEIEIALGMKPTETKPKQTVVWQGGKPSEKGNGHAGN